MNQMTSKRKNSRFFWKLLHKLNTKTNESKFKKGISASRWKAHFQKLFTKNDNSDIPNSPSSIGPLDYDITLEELENASYILRPGKSTGKDSVSNEMIRCFLKTHPDIQISFSISSSLLKDRSPSGIRQFLVQFTRRVQRWTQIITGPLRFPVA